MAYKLPYTGEEYLNKIKNPQPINLLDNSDFTNPVNQREWSMVSGPIWQMCIDRYYCTVDEGNDLILTSEGFVANGSASLQQRLPKGVLKENTIYTRVIYFADGVIRVATDDINTERNDFDYISWGIGGKYYGEQGKVAISHIALYEGEYDEKTAPKYQPKGYAVEFKECQRHYQKIYTGTVRIRGDVNRAQLFFTLPVPMRSIPTAQIHAGGLILQENDSSLITSVNEIYMHTNYAAGYINITPETPFQISTWYIGYPWVNGIINLSAEL